MKHHNINALHAKSLNMAHSKFNTTTPMHAVTLKRKNPIIKKG